jgi:hypothetical protein
MAVLEGRVEPSSWSLFHEGRFVPSFAPDWLGVRHETLYECFTLLGTYPTARAAARGG